MKGGEKINMPVKPKVKASDKPKVEAEAAPKVAAAPPVKFKYLCPACKKTAIETSNKMLGVDVVCKSCGKKVKLDDVKNYQKLK